MRERMGLRDWLLLGLLSACLVGQSLVLLQKHHDAEAVADENKVTRDRLAQVEKQLSETTGALRDVAAAIRGATGASSKTGVDLSAVSKAVTKAVETAGGADVPLGGELVWGFVGNEPGSLNPLTARDMYARYVVRENRVFEYLVSRDRMTAEWKGVLAKSWKFGEDGLSLTFELHPEARWSDGKPLTADDVVFTFRLVLDPLCDCPNLRTYLNYLDEQDPAEALGPHTVRFKLKEKYFGALAGIGNTVPILPRHVYESTTGTTAESFAFNKITGKLPTHPIVGSGPYVFKSWNVGKDIILERNANYWGRPRALERYRMVMRANAQAALQELLAGKIDYLLDPEQSQFDERRRDPEFLRKFHALTWDSPDGGYRYVGWNNRLPQFRDALTRRALTMLLDREGFLRELDYNLGRVSNGDFWPGGKQADPTIKPWPYDPAEARKLLEQAGWKRGPDGILARDGVPFRFKFQITTGREIYQHYARRLKDSFSAVGIDVSIEQFEWAVYSQNLTERKFEVVCLGWGGGDVEKDPFQIWHGSQAENRGSNYIGFRNAEADRLIEEARRELDEGKRNDLFRRFHRILHEEQPYTFLTQRFNCAFVNNKFAVKVGKLGVETLDWYIPDPANRRLRGD